jgi:uncharacterized protein YlaN (UPF0358 family)
MIKKLLRRAIMLLNIIKDDALEALNQEASKIRQLITNQRNYQCITQCKAFEEVVDTQMFGFSKQVEYAQKIGILTREEGTKLIVSLEQELNQVYGLVYDEQKKKDLSSERK